MQEQAIVSDEIARNMDAVQKIASEMLASSEEAVIQGEQLHELAYELEESIGGFNLDGQRARTRAPASPPETTRRPCRGPRRRAHARARAAAPDRDARRVRPPERREGEAASATRSTARDRAVRVRRARRVPTRPPGSSTRASERMMALALADGGLPALLG